MPKESTYAGDKNFDRYEVGEVIVTPARTITEADVVAFAGLTGDYHWLHTDAIAAKKSGFGDRIGHGTLTFAIVSGLIYRAGVSSQYSIGFLGATDWAFKSPVYFGETIQARVKVEKKRASESKPDRGIVTFFIEVINQSKNNQVVCEGRWTQMYSRG